MLLCVINEEMDVGCEKRLVLQITKQVSNVLARPDASNEDKKRAYEQLLGIRWSKPLIKEVSPHMLSGLVRRGLYNPATTQMATILRNGLSEIWRSIGGEVDADSGSWWSFIEKHGLTNGLFTIRTTWLGPDGTSWNKP